MVKILSRTEHEQIAEAVKQAEAKTAAEIVMVIRTSSCAHADFVLFYAFLASLMVGFGLYMSKVFVRYPELMMIQWAVIVLIFFTPFLRHLCWRLMPVKLMHRRTALQAYADYQHVHRQSPQALPFVLMYISLGERHAHIIPSHAVYEKVDNAHWGHIINGFGKAMKGRGLATACSEAATHMGKVLAEHFPGHADTNLLRDNVIVKDMP